MQTKISAFVLGFWIVKVILLFKIELVYVNMISNIICSCKKIMVLFTKLCFQNVMSLYVYGSTCLFCISWLKNNKNKSILNVFCVHSIHIFIYHFSFFVSYRGFMFGSTNVKHLTILDLFEECMQLTMIVPTLGN